MTRRETSVHSAQLKARVAIAALRGESGLAERFGVSSDEIALWQAQLVEGAEKCFDGSLQPEVSADALQTLRDDESRYRALLESTQHAFCVLRPIVDESGRGYDYRFLDANSAFEHHTGLVDVVGKRALELVPDLEPHWGEVYARIVRTRRPERFVKQAEALGRWFEVDAFPIGKPNEWQVGVLFTDVTAFRQAEESLRLANEQLRKADQRKDEFLAMLAHELRNPLAGLAMAGKLLERPGLDGARVEALREMSQRQLSTLTRLVDDLLDVSRITRGVVSLRHERVELGEAVKRALNASYLLMEKQHDVSLNLPDAPVPVMGDPVRLEQVLVNLLSNAAKYTDRQGHIAVFLQCHGGEAELRVIDNGIGLDPGQEEHIFRLFGQGKRRLDRAEGGLGIGLTLVKHLVARHGGRIEARSEGPGKGSEFIMTLPLATSATDAASVEPAPVEGSATRRILVVDDNVDAANSLATLLEMQGHRVSVAYDGRTALAMATEERPELLLLDIGMPGMDGYELARRLRRDPAMRHAVFAAITGYGLARDHEQALAAGFDKHFVKPVDIDQLVAFVSTA